MADSNSVVDVLILARSYIEKGWCQNIWARDSKGKACMHYDPRAVSWCIVGSVGLAERLLEISTNANHYELLRKTAETAALSPWNDDGSRTKEEVLEVFDKAISNATT